MKRKKVWRFYCDFCKKSGCSGGAIAKHEKSCTMNPNRVCGMCAADQGRWPAEYPTVASLIEAAKKDSESHKIDGDLEWQVHDHKHLLEVSDGCPACMMAGIRQSGLDIGRFAFDYKQQHKEFWTRVNDHYSE